MGIGNWFKGWFHGGKEKPRTQETANKVLGRVVKVFNTKRKFGEAKYYYVVFVEVVLKGRRENIIVPLAFTSNSFIFHMLRGMKQDEDVERALKHMGANLDYVEDLDELDKLI